MTKTTVWIVGLALLRGLAGAATPEPEPVRRFFDEGGAWLASAGERADWPSAGAPSREEIAEHFLARTPDLAAAIARRRQEVLDADLSFFDERARLLFLHGTPSERTRVECGETFRPIEIWRWRVGDASRGLILVQKSPAGHYLAWRPTTSKRVLYTDEMEYLLEQFEELRGRIRGRRPDLQLCRQQALEIDTLTGVSGLFDFRSGRMTDADVESFFTPPPDLAAWARGVLATPPAATTAAALPEPEVRFSFPEAKDQRILTRIRLTLPAGLEPGVVAEGSARESRLAVTAVFDRPDGVFDQVRTRFVFEPPAHESPVVLEVERPLRPRERFVARFEVRDETNDRRVVFDRGFEVPAAPVAEPDAGAAASTAALRGEEIGIARAIGRDTILLLPPVDDVVFGLWRAEAIVAGERIKKVVFLLDGKPQLTRGSPPWSAELRLPNVPEETIVRVEGLDDAGDVLAADEILLNEPQNEPRVKLLAPPRGRNVSGRVKARAAVVVPQGERVDSVEFKLNDKVVAELSRPPWEADVDVPASRELTYLTVTAIYADGTRAEDVRVLNANEFTAAIQVDLVEVYATVTDRGGQLVQGLTGDDFEIRDNGRAQELARFEVVRDLPLTLGLLLDTSGSMGESLGEAKRAATDFLAAVMTPRDRCFAVGFSQRPALLMPLTPDARALETAFKDLPAYGSTSLHDALVYGLYQFRGVRGRKAMVLLSDGDDTSSLVPFADALAFAERSGVAIYTIGLDIGRASVGIRGKLEKLATETGGRTFYIAKASELAGVYEMIERELRSQYFLAFAPDPPPAEGERHALEIVVQGGKLRARAARGYTP